MWKIISISPLLLFSWGILTCCPVGANTKSESSNDKAVGSGTALFEDARQGCVDKINSYRNDKGLPALIRWREGEQCADAQAENDALSGKAHEGFSENVGDCAASAQNECPDYSSIPDVLSICLQMMWDEGPGEPYSSHGHYLNMTNLDYKKVACGFHVLPNGNVWSVQNFSW